jgi:hypothetical protein
MHYKNGSVYKGEWKNNKENGKGVWTLKDGTSYSGIFNGSNATSVLCTKKSSSVSLVGKLVNGKFIAD